MTSEITADGGAEIKLISILIGCSGDMIPQRQAAPQVARALNRADRAVES
jgi:hypothetical protein